MPSVHSPVCLHLRLFVTVFCAFSSIGSPTDADSNFPWPPRTPDPNFPKVPYELMQRVDSTCQNILYLGTASWASISDQSFIEWMGECIRASRHYCYTEKCPFARTSQRDTVVYYQRSHHGVWIALGVPREKRPKCTEPFLTDSDLNKVFVQMEQHFMQVLGYKNGSNAWANSSQRLVRTFDLPLPAPLPATFAKMFPEECRYSKYGWNVNYKRRPDERFYWNCNMTAESAHYCVEPVDRSQYPNRIEQALETRSMSGFYEIGGMKSAHTFLPVCALP